MWVRQIAALSLIPAGPPGSWISRCPARSCGSRTARPAAGSCSPRARRGCPGWRRSRPGRTRTRSRWSSRSRHRCPGSGPRLGTGWAAQAALQPCPPAGPRCGWSRTAPRCSCARTAESRFSSASSRPGMRAARRAARPARRSSCACDYARGRWLSGAGSSSPPAPWRRCARGRDAAASSAARAAGTRSAGCGTPRLRCAGRSRSCCCRCRSRASPWLRGEEAWGIHARGIHLKSVSVRRGARVSACFLLWISSCEPVSLAHDRPQPAYIARGGQWPAPCPRAPPVTPPGLASARRMRGWMLRQVCPVPREKLINIMTPAVFVRPAQRSVPVITASQSERAAGHANYTQCPPARQKGPNPLREFKPKTWKKVEEESRGRETSTSSSPPGWDTLRRIHPSILCLLFHKHRKRSSSRRRKELHPNKEN